MSVRLSDYAIDEEEWIPTLDEEAEWPPNPYQAQAEEQVRAGAWPGCSYLMAHARPYCSGTLVKAQWPPASSSTSEPAPHDGPLWSMKGGKLGAGGGAGGDGDGARAGAEPPAPEPVPEGGGEPAASSWEAASGASGSDDDPAVWKGKPWRWLFEFRLADRYDKQGGEWDSQDEGDVDADLPETPCSTTEATEGDDSGTPCSTSQRSGSGALKKLSHHGVPRNTDLSQFSNGNVLDASITTLMIRNIPNGYTRSMLMEELDSLSFACEYDFIYLPIDKSTQWNVGYAFVNFTSNEAARRCVDVMTNYSFCRFEHGSGKVAQVSIAHIQGLERNLQYYSNTAVQSSRIPSHRPLVLAKQQQQQQQQQRQRQQQQEQEHEQQQQQQEPASSRQPRRRRRLRVSGREALPAGPAAAPRDPGLLPGSALPPGPVPGPSASSASSSSGAAADAAAAGAARPPQDMPLFQQMRGPYMTAVEL